MRADDKHGAGMAHYQAGRLGLAETSLKAAAAANPRSAAVRHDLGLVLRARGRLALAARAFEEAIALDPSFVGAHFALIAVRQKMDGDAAAEAPTRRLVAAFPGAAPVHVLLGDVLRGLGRLDEARLAYHRALTLEPRSAEARFGLGFLSLLEGDFAAGLPDYEFRASRRSPPPPPLARQWRGEDPAGKILLLYAEQGMGDTLQFLRFAAPLAARGARVLAAVPIPLMDLAAQAAGVHEVVQPTHSLPAFDACCPLPSLPLMLGTGPGSIPSPGGYLSAPADRVEAWRARLGKSAGRTVAISWAGNPDHPNDHNRSLSPADLAPLLKETGYRWLNLQKGAEAADFRTRRGGPEVVALGDHLADFSDTAAVLTLADHVISVDTALCHLAGALGRPTSLLLPFAPDWRWLLGRRDSPWYDSVRLYRQAAPRDWTGVVAEVADDLFTRSMMI